MPDHVAIDPFFLFLFESGKGVTAHMELHKPHRDRFSLPCPEYSGEDGRPLLAYTIQGTRREGLLHREIRKRLGTMALIPLRTASYCEINWGRRGQSAEGLRGGLSARWSNYPGAPEGGWRLSTSTGHTHWGTGRVEGNQAYRYAFTPGPSSDSCWPEAPVGFCLHS